MVFQPTLLKDKVGIVTGAGSPYGIGRSLVLGLAAAGARAVYATDINMVCGIESLQNEVKKSGSLCTVHVAQLDVTSEEQTRAVIEEVLSAYGQLDFFFANAGLVSSKSLAETDVAHYDRINCILQRSVFLAVKYAGHAMSAVSAQKPSPCGSIIATASIAGLSGSIADLSYSTAKAGVAHLVQCASVQLSATNIRVNAIAPGLVRTSIFYPANLPGDGHDRGSFSKEDALRRYDAVAARLQQGGQQY